MSTIESDLALLRTAALFDLSTAEGRKESVSRLRALFYRLHEIAQPRTVFEIGAKEATFSRTVRQLLPEARVIAFEANPFVFNKQRKASDPTNDGVDYLRADRSSWAAGEANPWLQLPAESAGQRGDDGAAGALHSG